jgi:hypothetical protein
MISESLRRFATLSTYSAQGRQATGHEQKFRQYRLAQPGFEIVGCENCLQMNNRW